MRKKIEPVSKAEVAEFIENEPSISSWLSGQAEGTKYNYGRALIRYTRFHGMTLEKLLEVAEEGKRTGKPLAEKLIDEYAVNIDLPESQKKLDVAAVHSFHKANYQVIASKAGRSKVRYTKVKPYVCPTQQELRDLERDAHIRDKAIINLISSGGFREETASDLTWGDLRELWNCDAQKSIWDGKMPIYVGVESRRLKGGGIRGYEGVEQHTFLTPHACEVFLRYVDWYRGKRELNEYSPLIVSLAASATKPAFTALGPQSFLTALQRLGRFTPHDLRRYAQTQLEAARINPNWIKKMQGKKLKGEDNPYSRPKIEQMREAFAAAEPYITLAESKLIDSREALLQRIRDFAAFVGGKVEMLSDGRVMVGQRAYAPEDAIGAIRAEREKEDAKKDEQQIVDVDKLANHLSHGWRFVASLGNGKCVVERG